MNLLLVTIIRQSKMDYLDYDDFSPCMKFGGGTKTTNTRSKKKTKEGNKNGADTIYNSKHIRVAQDKQARAMEVRKKPS